MSTRKLKFAPNSESAALLQNAAEDSNTPGPEDIQETFVNFQNYDSVQAGRRPSSSASSFRSRRFRSNSAISFHSSPQSLYFYLYLSHFLSTWNARVLEYGATLFLSSLFPKTFVPLSLYALFRSLSAITFSHPLGEYVDTTNRLKVVRTSIVYQRLAVAITCLGFWAMDIDINRSREESPEKSIYTFQIVSLMVIIIVCACVERLCSTMNMVAVERDWVVVLSKSSILHDSFDFGDVDSNESQQEQDTSSLRSEDTRMENSSIVLQTLNARMRRIDLICKLLGPLAFSYLFAYFDIVPCLMILLFWNLGSMLIEYGTIENVYRRCLELHVPKTQKDGDAPLLDAGDDDQASDRSVAPSNSLGPQRSIVSRLVHDIQENFIRPFSFYFSHPMALASFSLSLLYLTVLSFGAQLVSFLLFCGSTSVEVGLLRTFSVLCELSATFIAPFAMRKVGPKVSGSLFVSWQALCLLTGLLIAWPILNWNPENGPLVYLYKFLDLQGYIPSSSVASSTSPKFDFGSFAPKTLLFVFVFSIAFSRIGLWGFDLSVQVLIQEGVSPTHQARFSSTEAACQSFFELLSFVQTLIWNTPQQFRWPALLSVVLTITAALVFYLFLGKSKRTNVVNS